MVNKMTDLVIVKCNLCGQKVIKEHAAVVSDPNNDDEPTYSHEGCVVDNTEEVTCMICNKRFKMITPGHLSKHDTTVREYKLRYGPVVSESQTNRLRALAQVRGGDEQLQAQIVELKTQLETARTTIENNIRTIEQMDEPDQITGWDANTGPRTRGVVFTMEEIKNIGAVALREMVKCKFGRHESKKSQNIGKLGSLVE